MPPVYAVGVHAANTACTYPDVTKTSALEVTHQTGPSYLGSPTVVEPDTGERWKIEAFWYPAAAPPAQVLETAFVDVDWNGSSWVLSNMTLTTNIVGITICQGSTCDAGGGNVHSWNYKLIVNLNDPGALGYNLDNVRYTTVNVDDGTTVEDPSRTYGDCYLGTAVQPTSQAFGATDYNADWGTAGRCPYNCTITGASTTITYD